MINKKSIKIHKILFKNLFDNYNNNNAEKKDAKTLKKEIGISVNNYIKYLNSYLNTKAKTENLSSGFVENEHLIFQSIGFGSRFHFYSTIIKPLVTASEWRTIQNQFIAELNKRVKDETYFNYYRSTAMYLLYSFGRGPLYMNIFKNALEIQHQYDIVVQNFHGKMKDFLLSKILYTALSKKIAIADSTLRNYFTNCESTYYKGLIQEKIEQVEALALTSDTAFNEVISYKGNKRTTINNIIKKYKGQLILLDFWAPWCERCRADDPFLEALKTQYKKEKIKFIKISIDKNYERWKAYVNCEKERRNNYMMNHFKKSFFMKKYQINTIPRYILIGKNGQVISEEAPWPSEKALQVLINENL